MLMYKQLFFLHKSDNDKAFSHFNNVIVKHLEELSGNSMKLAKVESNLLLDQKYSYFCEVEFESKDRMNELMNSKAGKKLSKDLADFHQMMTVISVNYEFDK